MKKTAVFLLVLMMVFSCVGCGDGGSNKKTSYDGFDVSNDTGNMLIPETEVVSGGTEQTMADSFSGEVKDAVFTVNGEPVDAEVYAYAVNDFGLRYVQSLIFTGAVADVESFDWNAKDPNFDGTYLDYVKYSALEDLVPRYTIIAEAKRRGVFLAEEDKLEADAWVETQQGERTDKEFEELLKASGCPSIRAFKAFRELSILEAKAVADFEANQEKYATREQLISADERELVTVKHILIAFDPEQSGAEVTPQMKSAAKAKADAVLAKVRAGEDFDALIDEYNDDPGAKPEGYTFADDGTMVQEFADASFSLEIGGVSGLVETPYGYHIIKRLERAVTITDYAVLLNKNAKVTINKSVFEKMEVTVDLKKYMDDYMNSMIGG